MHIQASGDMKVFVVDTETGEQTPIGDVQEISVDQQPREVGTWANASLTKGVTMSGDMELTEEGRELFEQMKRGCEYMMGQGRYPRPYGTPYRYKPHRKPKKKPGRKKRGK